MVEIKPSSILFCGYAKLAANSAVGNMYEYLTLSLMIDENTGIIEDACVTVLGELAQRMIKNYFIGHHIVDDLDAITADIQHRHQGNLQKPIIKALHDINHKWTEFKAQT